MSAKLPQPSQNHAVLRSVYDTSILPKNATVLSYLEDLSKAIESRRKSILLNPRTRFKRCARYESVVDSLRFWSSYQPVDSPWMASWGCWGRCGSPAVMPQQYTTVDGDFLSIEIIQKIEFLPLLQQWSTYVVFGVIVQCVVDVVLACHNFTWAPKQMRKYHIHFTHSY